MHEREKQGNFTTSLLANIPYVKGDDRFREVNIHIDHRTIGQDISMHLVATYLSRLKMKEKAFS